MRKRSGKSDAASFYHGLANAPGYDVDHLAAESGEHDLTVDIVQSIGNAAMLGKSANRSVQQRLFTSPEKQKALSQSIFYTTSGVVQDAEDRAGPLDKKAVSAFTTIKDITAEAIKKRKDEMLEMLEEDFGIRD